ncbi:DUF3565 domain-containing protein [Colwellia sp. MB02u-18]|uniref:DUF3565 domain-containing protein n=1 Tax=unclassified Colwellia TaxID=196834 RepID=UPI0015F74154|nr:MULTISPECIES: DUF3565 domain-containing protein [unclassified Colwellia]MBA6225503.1 DUF3565 domain-containing protein [Colwellia sp. MB3u-45]MBA6266396.1 DUF3565 domain-containing protein [Colwellia sp. MB3u-43]MBA6320684.1 DUF3565 domain-containing protein [Colwellia sp. MB02u-19]MBA6325506.1 DUF3565 domain-containing protein [Colwellia sp. MB02u-18]MBA6331981.1 DUF3565 domain-containing protein [Colwellia sp. MB02u-12]
MLQAIIDYHLDDENHWVARLECGHFQHVRHQPPFINRPWVVNKATRHAMLGQQLNCIKCEHGAARDFPAIESTSSS